MAFKIWIDLDGVLTDFNKALSNLLGRPVKEDFGNDPKIWAAITNAGESFWSNMNFMPDGRELWEAIEIYKPTILSAPTRHKSSIEGKKKWLKNNLPGVPYIIDQDKASHADKDSILIDDREKNIKKWEEAGGIGILHKDTKTTLYKLQKAIGIGKEAKWVESPNRDKRVFIPVIRGGRPEKPIIPEKGPYKREKFKLKDIEANMNTITEKLDSIANTLEFKGLIKEAAEIDVISNTLEAGELPHTKDRPAPIFPKESPKVKDDKDHFPIPDKNHGLNALARVNQYGAAPSWYEGSLEDLKAAVLKAVKSKFPGIEIEEKKFKP
jgi:5'(3')-deoxyribonucleotidase